MIFPSPPMRGEIPKAFLRLELGGRSPQPANDKLEVTQAPTQETYTKIAHQPVLAPLPLEIGA